MAQLVGPGVELLDVEQLELGGRVGFQRVLLGLTVAEAARGRCRACSPGSPPYRPVPRASRASDHRQPGPLGRPVRHVDQRRAALLEELRRRVVAQVAGDVDVGVRCRATSSSRKSPAPPHTATRRTGRSGSPATRTPCAVCGQRLGDGCGELAQRRRLDVADPAGAGGRRARGRRARRRRTPAPRRGGRPASPRPPAPRDARQHHLDPDLVDHLDLPDRADRRVGALERPEPALARRRERRVVVVADPAGPGLGERGPDPVGVGRRARRRRACRAARRRGRSGRTSVRPSACASASETPPTPGRRWCARSAARSRRRRAWPGSAPSAWSPRSRAPA